MEKILRTNKLSKIYINKVALNNINIEIEHGRVLGLLGPNGSGKTTTYKNNSWNLKTK